MSDFISLAQTFGLPLAMTLVAVLAISRALVRVSAQKDQISDSRYDDMKSQFEARLVEQRANYEQRIKDLDEDREWVRDQLNRALGVTDAGTATVEEMVRRVLARQSLPPRSQA